MGPGSIPKIGDKWAREKLGTEPRAGKKPNILPRKPVGRAAAGEKPEIWKDTCKFTLGPV